MICGSAAGIPERRERLFCLVTVESDESSPFLWYLQLISGPLLDGHLADLTVYCRIQQRRPFASESSLVLIRTQEDARGLYETEPLSSQEE